MARIKKYIFFLFLICSILSANANSAGEGLVFNTNPLPDLPLKLEGAYWGRIGEHILVAGGVTNEDSLQVWQRDVYLLSANEESWKKIGQLDQAMAFGAALNVPDGLLLLGGITPKGYSNKVVLIDWNETKSNLELKLLPSLPKPEKRHFLNDDSLNLFSATFWNNSVYALVFGQDVAELNLTSEHPEWKKLDPIPGSSGLSSILTVQTKGPGEDLLLSFGRQGQYHSLIDLNEKPFEQGWRQISGIPGPLPFREVVPYGQSHVLVFTDQNILAYHTITDTWVVCENNSFFKDVVPNTWNNNRVLVKEGKKVFQVSIERQKASFGWLNIIVLTVYLLLLVGVGIYFSKREKSTGDFFLAGQRIPWWAAGISIYATQLSAITFLATPAVAYTSNWLVYPAMACILLIAPIVVQYYLPFFRRLKVTTAYEYLERRFNLAVRWFGSISFIAFQFGRMAVIIYLPALALSTVTGINVYTCILLMGVLSTLYTFLGGMEAVIWTDVIQVVVLKGGVVLALILIFNQEGGMLGVLAEAGFEGKTQMTDWTFSFTELVTWSLLLGNFFNQFGPYTTDQAVVQRYLTTKDERSAGRGIWLNGLMALPFGLLFFLLGASLFVFFRNHPEMLQVGMQNDEIFPLFMAKEMPAGIGGLVIAGVFAASMSSLDSSMHSISTSVTTDFYGRLSDSRTDHQRLKFARFLIVLVGILAVTMAFLLVSFDIKSLFFFFQKILGLLGSGLAGVFILGIFFKRTSSVGALAGAVISTLILGYVAFYTSLNFYLYAVVGILSCVITGLIVSLIFPPKRNDLKGLTIYSKGEIGK